MKGRLDNMRISIGRLAESERVTGGKVKMDFTQRIPPGVLHYYLSTRYARRWEIDMEEINAFAAAVTVPFTEVSGAFGWFGWLAAVFVACLAGDWITGTAAAAKNCEWNSKISRDGIWHKAGCIVVVLAAAVLDRVIGEALNSIPGISPPFTYTVLLCPIVLVWYILTELGSIIDNAGRMGAPVPGFLKKAIALFKGTVAAVGDKLTENK